MHMYIFKSQIYLFQGRNVKHAIKMNAFQSVLKKDIFKIFMCIVCICADKHDKNNNNGNQSLLLCESYVM